MIIKGISGERRVCGVGFNDVRGFRRKNEFSRHVYAVWRGMLQRCYSPNNNKTPTYKDCSVCDRWLTLSNFIEDIKSLVGYDKLVAYIADKKSFSANERIELDKDGLFFNNKVYSPETCRFVTHRENVAEMHRRTKCLKTGNYSEGRKAKLRHAKFPPNAIVNSNKVTSKKVLLEQDDNTIVFSSIRKCAEFIGCDPKWVSVNAHNNGLIKGKYTVKFIEEVSNVN